MLTFAIIYILLAVASWVLFLYARVNSGHSTEKGA